MIHDGKYISVKLSHLTPSRKTAVYQVSNKQNIPLGLVSYRSAWRKYVFLPDTNTMFDETCLSEVSAFLNYARQLDYERQGLLTKARKS